MQSYSSVVTHSSRFERSDLFHFLPKRQPKPSTDEGYWDCSVCTFKNSAEAFKCSMCDVRKGTSTRTSFGTCGRKPENPEETHADTGRTCKLHTDSDPSWESNPGPWRCEATVLTTVLPCCPGPSQGKPPVSITTSKSHPGRPTRSNPSSMKPRPVSQLVAQQVSQQFASPTQPKKEKKDKGEKEKNEKETVSKKNSHKKTRPRLKNVDRSSAQHLEVTVGDLTVIITDFKEKARSAPAATATSSTTADQHSLSSSSSDNTEKGLSRSSSPRGEGSVNGESH
ncbi:YY1-associated factor 2 isoform X3 [Scyliorhinus torazame]|uniref:YY1-associated factor 2 isoform X3 n=1 Tax=Scyliorhinus torazame TaxID=75743 RepID=UPI003B5B1B7B